MTPERLDDLGIVYFWDDKLGVPENGYWKGCHFVAPEDYLRVSLNWPKQWNHGKTGTWVGWQERIDNSYDKPFPRLESVVWDGENSVEGIHKQWLIFEAKS